MRLEPGHGRVLVQVDEHVGRKLVQLALAARVLIEIFAQPPIAEIAEQQQALVEIAREDLRRAQADRGEPLGDGDERPRVLVRRRRVHQHRASGRR